MIIASNCSDFLFKKKTKRKLLKCMNGKKLNFGSSKTGDVIVEGTSEESG